MYITEVNTVQCYGLVGYNVCPSLTETIWIITAQISLFSCFLFCNDQTETMYTQTIMFGKHVYRGPRKTDQGVQLYPDGTDDRVVLLSVPQRPRRVGVADLVHCGVPCCTLPRGWVLRRYWSGIHGAIYILIPNCVSY